LFRIYKAKVKLLLFAATLNFKGFCFKYGIKDGEAREIECRTLFVISMTAGQKAISLKP
jgi:hypothetical protein